MAAAKPSRLKGCLMGCGCLVLVSILGFGGWIGATVLKTRGAMAARDALDAAYPGQEEYVPPFDDAFDPDRLQRYLAVRSELLGSCADFDAVLGAFAEMEARGDAIDGRDGEPSLTEVLGMLQGTGGLVGKAMGLAGNVADYQVRRDRALLAQGMGLGEATWIQAAACYGLLGHEPVFLMPEQDRHGRNGFRRRLNTLVRGMVARHLAELKGALDPAPGAVPPGDAAPAEADAALVARIAAWQAELDALEADSHRLPFQDGLPAAMAASLQPYRAELERTWCEATSGLDLMRGEGHGTRMVLR